MLIFDWWHIATGCTHQLLIKCAAEVYISSENMNVYCDMAAGEQNHESVTDSRCEITGCISMVAHVHTSDVSCWSTPRLHSNIQCMLPRIRAVNYVGLKLCFLFSLPQNYIRRIIGKKFSSWCPLLQIEGVAWSMQRIPTAWESDTKTDWQTDRWL
jgi:hypothetical protein